MQNNPLTNTDPTGLALQLSCYNDPDTATTSTDAKGNTTITTTAGAQHCTAWDDGQGRYTGTLPQLRLASFTPPSPAPNNGMSRYPFPANAVPCSTNSGANFMAPPGFSVSNISANGQTNGLTGAGAAVGQFGYYDYQRYVTGPGTFNFYYGYTPVANIAVGAYEYGMGLSPGVGSLLSNTFATLFSSNGPTAQQAQFRNVGFALASGKATYTCQSHP